MSLAPHKDTFPTGRDWIRELSRQRDVTNHGVLELDRLIAGQISGCETMKGYYVE